MRRRGKRKTTKGALIKGMSRKLPSDILASPIFRAKLKELLRARNGDRLVLPHLVIGKLNQLNQPEGGNGV